MSISTEERRRYPRAAIECELVLGSDPTPSWATIMDISEQGAQLIGAQEIPFEEDLELRIPLERPDGKTATCRVVGNIVRREGLCAALRFLPVRPADMLRLRDFVWRQGGC